MSNTLRVHNLTNESWLSWEQRLIQAVVINVDTLVTSVWTNVRAVISRTNGGQFKVKRTALNRVRPVTISGSKIDRIHEANTSSNRSVLSVVSSANSSLSVANGVDEIS